jgi:hypothetical protein
MRQPSDIIGALARRVDGIASGDFRRSLMSAMSERVHQLIVDGFVQERDPTGKAWPPRKGKGTWPILDTRRAGGAVGALTVRPSTEGVTVRTNAYMRYHLTGVGNMPVRKWIPTSPGELDPIWRPALMTVYAKKLLERLKASG